MVAHGIVKLFKPKEGYGFLIPCDVEGQPTGESDVFFHLSDGRLVGDDGWEPVFESSSRAFRRERVLPKRDDRVVYIEQSGRRGIKARRWGYLDDWHDAIGHLGLDQDNSDSDEDADDEDDDSLTTTGVFNQAMAQHGNPELAREAATQYPGDYIK